MLHTLPPEIIIKIFKYLIINNSYNTYYHPITSSYSLFFAFNIKYYIPLAIRCVATLNYHLLSRFYKPIKHINYPTLGIVKKHILILNYDGLLVPNHLKIDYFHSIKKYKCITLIEYNKQYYSFSKCNYLYKYQRQVYHAMVKKKYIHYINIIHMNQINHF